MGLKLIQVSKQVTPFMLPNPYGKDVKGQSVNRSRELVLAQEASANACTGLEVTESISNVR